MSDKRSERLRKRRNRSEENTRARASIQQTDDADPDESNPQPESTDTAAPDSEEETADSGDGSIKDEQVGTYMYLPQEQAKGLKRQYNVLKAEYEFEFDAEFEKNRHFYPLVVKFGREHLEGLDALEIQDRLEEIQRD
jgi:hypothetical protein